MSKPLHQPRFGWRLAAAAGALLAALLTPTAASAAEDDVQFVGQEPSSRCDIDAFADTKLVAADAPYETIPGLAVGETAMHTLNNPVQGRVLVHGLLGDLNHSFDVPDFTPTLSQFGERFHVVFYGEDGSVVGQTDDTPDLPDLGVTAPFALPTVDLSAPAIAIKLVHRSMDNTSADSVVAECLNIDEIAPDATPTDRLNWQPCPHDSEVMAPDLVCGFLAVPENRHVDGSRLINVFFAIQPGDGTHADPLVYLEGGPGTGPVTYSEIILQLAMIPVADGRDIIMVDQRGTGYSNPNLVCLRPQDLLVLPAPTPRPTTEEIRALYAAAAADCKPRLEAEGIDLAGYTTVASAQDFAELRHALGVAEWNLFGGSYGTNLGLTIMRDAPDGVRSAVLDSVYTPEVNPMVGDDKFGVGNTLDQSVARCLDDPECAAAFPDPVGTVNAALASLATEPVYVEGDAVELVTGLPALTFDPIELVGLFVFDEADPYLFALAAALADSDDPTVRSQALEDYIRVEAETILDEIAAAIAAADGAAGDLAALRGSGWGIPGLAGAPVLGMFLSVTCAEEYANRDQGPATVPSPTNWDPAVDEAGEILASLFVVEEQCEIWDVPSAGAFVGEPIHSDIASLVLRTDIDAQTWPEWSVLAAETLPNSFSYEFPQLNHVVTFTNECPQSVVGQFLNSPTTAPDASCIDELPTIHYNAEIPKLPPLPPLEEIFG